MAIVTGYTAEFMDEIANSTVVGGSVNSSGNLTLTTRDGRTIDAGRMSTAFLESLVPPMVSTAMSKDSTIAAAGRTAAASAVASELATQGDTILQAARWSRGGLPAGTDLNTFLTPGLYRIASNDIVNMPLAGAGGSNSGFLNVYNIIAGSATWAAQEYYRYGTAPERWWRVSRNTTGAWNEWERVPTAKELEALNTTLKARMDTMTTEADWFRSTFTTEVDLDTLYEAGVWRISSVAPKNMPEFSNPGLVSGFVTVTNAKRSSSAVWAQQEFVRYGSYPERWWRISSNTNGSWSPWVEITSSHEGISNELLLQDFTRRRGGRKIVNTAVVALRFDHGLANFNSKIRPTLERLNLPYSLALCSGQWDRSENAGVTPYMVNSWVTGGLAEIWNHTKDHGSGSNKRQEWKAAINDGLNELRQQLPAAQIDGFAIPGSAGTSFGGFTTGGSAEEFYNTEGGRYILSKHAVSSGYIPNTGHRILDGTVRQGLGHYTIDAATLDTIQARIRTAVTNKSGLQLMLHPSLVDTAGYATTSIVISMLEHIAAERDAGRIAVMGPYDMLLADTTGISERAKVLEEAKEFTNTMGDFKVLSTTENLLSLPPGRYTQVNTGAVSYLELGYPVAARGMLIVHDWNSSGSYRVQQYFPLDQSAVYTRMIFSDTARPWLKHEDSGSINGFKSLSATDNLNTLPPGRYTQVYANQSPKELGYPVNKQGMLIVHDWNNAKSHRVQIFYPLDDAGFYTRVIYSDAPRDWVRHGDTNAIEKNIADAPLRAQKPVRKIITHSEKGHPYYVLAGSTGVVDLNDTSDAAVGFQSIKVTTDGKGGSSTIKADNIGPVDLTNSDLRVWIKVDNWDTNAGIAIFLGIGGMSKYVQYSLNSPAEKVYLQKGTWQLLTIPKTDANRVEGVTDYSAFTHIQIRSSDNSTGTFTYHLGPIYAQRRSSKFSKGVVSFSFDDSLASLYTQAKPVMDKYGFAGTAYITPESVGKAERVTLEQLHHMQNRSGWEIAGHSFTAAGHEARFTTLSEAELEIELSSLAKWLKDNHFNGTTLAYPGGMYNDTVKKVTLRHFKAGRSISQLWETLPPSDMAALRTPAYVLTPSTLVDTVKAQVDEAIREGYWMHLCFHDILPVAVQSTDYPTSDFEAICQYIYSKSIPVRTVAEVIDELE